jgi:hypothetical protein
VCIVVSLPTCLLPSVPRDCHHVASEQHARGQLEPRWRRWSHKLHHHRCVHVRPSFYPGVAIYGVAKRLGVEPALKKKYLSTIVEKHGKRVILWVMTL